MSYLFVVAIGAIAGFVVGKYVKGSEMGVLPDIIAGAVGACALVLFSRLIGIGAATGFAMSLVVAIVGGAATLYAMRYVLKEKPVVVTRTRRR
jgi:uncharacterized membrane protein YeaQ/YmgE (transglycosylase-associated protein family)